MGIASLCLRFVWLCTMWQPTKMSIVCVQNATENAHKTKIIDTVSSVGTTGDRTIMKERSTDSKLCVDSALYWNASG